MYNYNKKGSVYLRPPRRRGSGRILAAIILIWSILFLLAGISLAAGGVYLYFNTTLLYPYLHVLRDILFDSRILVVSLGAVVTICSLISVLGICTKKKQLLQIYCYTVILLLLVQFGVALFFFLNKQNLADALHYECASLLADTPTNTLYMALFDAIQPRLECCGCVAPADYTKLHRSTLPDSCYNQAGDVFDSGCLPTLYQLIDEQSTLQIVIGSLTAALLLFIILTINCYIIRHDYNFRGGSGSRNRVTPSPSPSVTHLNNWVTTTSPSFVEKGGEVERVIVMSREHSF